MEKVELRKSLLKTRQLMTVAQWREKSDRSCAYLPQLPIEPWEKLLQAICTKTGKISFSW
ncbi:hypothetical protein [Iningainema tapete]|uniref:hypothetical protein n=1 Tax=Iningainema tapete TaxID=2806730 RepID=UPI0030806E35